MKDVSYQISNSLGHDKPPIPSLPRRAAVQLQQGSAVCGTGFGGHIAEQQYSAMNVRFGSKADIAAYSITAAFAIFPAIRRLAIVMDNADSFLNLRTIVPSPRDLGQAAAR